MAQVDAWRALQGDAPGKRSRRAPGERSRRAPGDLEAWRPWLLANSPGVHLEAWTKKRGAAR